MAKVKKYQIVYIKGEGKEVNCLKCNGRGWNPKHKNCYHNVHDAYIRGCNGQRVCGACLSTGSTGSTLIKAVLLEIKLESNDFKSRRLAEKALQELEVK